MSSVKHRLCRLARFAAWAAIMTMIVTSITQASVSPNAAAMAPILETTIFVKGDEGPGLEYAVFDVPQAGEAVLRVVNAAKVGASLNHRMEGAEITLNGRVVVEPEVFNENTDVFRLPVTLLQGTNRLGVKLAAKTGRRLSVRIDAPADRIHLEPVVDTLSVGDSLRVEATLTGLGRPIRGAPIVFNLKGLGKIAQRSSSTGKDGVARTTLTGFQQAGPGSLTASTVGSEPFLNDAVAVQVVDKRSLALDTGIAGMTVAAGAEKPMALNLRFLKNDGKTYHIVFEKIVMPDSGVDIQTPNVPIGGIPVSEASTFVLRATIVGRRPGNYKVTSRAIVKETGETASVRVDVKVIKPQPAEALVLDPPLFVPAAITVATSTPVRFAASVSGVSKPPAFLELQEFKPNSGKWELVPGGLLRDDGLKGDMIAGNSVYARRIAVTGKEEGERRYRVAGTHDGKTIVSATRTLEVSRFFVGSDPDPPAFVKDPATDLKFVAERVIVSFLPSVHPARIEKIVDLATRKVTGQAGKVDGYTRQINVYRVELEVDPTATEAARAMAVKAAVSEFTTYDEVRYAHPNFQIEFAQVDPDGDCSGDCSAAGQWGALKIRAHEAWALSGGSGSNATKTVAVVDSGVKNDHPDLNGKVTGNSADLGDDSGKPGGHGTKVAGIIAARHDGVGISGIAHELPFPIWSFKVGINFSDEEKVRDKIIEAADTPDVWIINISTESIGFDLDDWECALQYATYPGTTVGSACTGKSVDGRNGKGKLVVVAAGNNGRDIAAVPKQYPCSYNLDGMLCVANTDVEDQLYSPAGGINASNYGEESEGMDLTAPGTNICTTNKNDGYGHTGMWYTGTSMAAPHVAGAAAILWSKEPGTGWTAAQVANMLKASAYKGVCGNGDTELEETCDDGNITDGDSCPADCGKSGSPYLNKLGSGRLDLYAALAAVNANAPVADAESFTAPEGATATQADLDAGSSLLDGDTDADLPNDTLTVNTTPVSGPSHGVLSLSPDGSFSYTHDGSENFSDSFTYEVSDAVGHTSQAAVTITITPVNDNAPVADAESFTVPEGATATQADLDAGSSLLDGDTDADLPNDTMTVNTTPVSGPTHGVLTLNSDGSFSYTHDGSENFSDSFTYEVSDAVAQTSQATVTITITPVNDNAPVADAESFTVPEGATATQADLDAGSSLLDGDTDADLPNDTMTVNTTPVSGPTHGVLTLLTAEGHFSYTHDGSGNFSDSFTYEVSDAVAQTSQATVTITITPVNEEPSFTILGDQTVTENAGPQAVPNFATAQPGGELDEAGQTFTYNVSSSNTSLISVGPTISPDGTLTFTPATDSLGKTEVTVSVTDSGGTANGGDNTSPDQMFFITIRKQNRFVLVLDKSGSMNWSARPTEPGCEVFGPPPVGCEPSRWEALLSATETMLAVAESYALPADLFAVAFFDSGVSSANRQDFTGLGPAGAFATDSSRVPSGSTSIGAGVKAFENELGAGAPASHQTILLFTDGEQNRQPYMVSDGSEVFINPTAPSTTGATVFAPGAVDICPYALRADDFSGTLLNEYFQNIANARCDGFMESALSLFQSDPAPTEFFVQVMNRALVGDKLELAQVTHGRLIQEEGSQIEDKFTISRQDRAFTVLISWFEAGNKLKKVVLSKNGVDFPDTGGTGNIKVSQGDSFTAITLRWPYCNPAGECVNGEGQWTLRMQPLFENKKTFTYNIYVDVDNASLSSKFSISQPQPGVNQPLELTAELTEAGQPVHGLPSGSVVADLRRPGASLGNVLSKATVKPAKTPDVDTISPAGLKATAMLADPKFRSQIPEALNPDVKTRLVLTESAPGRYKASYNETDVSGIYKVRFLVKGQSASNGEFMRTFSATRAVEVIADVDATRKTVEVSMITPCQLNGGCYAITLTPIDASGNLLGPGKADLINIEKFPGRILQPTADELNGSYTIRIGYPMPVRKIR